MITTIAIFVAAASGQILMAANGLRDPNGQGGNPAVFSSLSPLAVPL
ncbi:MAG TPA: hypothetical protein VIY52_17515 [Streptosporangiaceae bacterium]